MSKFLFFLALLIGILLAPVLFHPSLIIGNYGDIFLHYYPLKHLVTEQMIRGQMPLWNPYIFAGAPLLANPQSAAYYPLSPLFYLLPLHYAFTVFFAVHLWLAGFFCWLMLRALSCSKGASAVGSLAFTFSSFMIYKIPAGHPVALSGFVWIAAVMLALEGLKGTVSRRWDDASPERVISVLFAAFVFTAIFLSGHLQPAASAIVIVLVHLSWHRFSYSKELLIASLIAFGFCACQLLPTLELSRVTERGNWPELVKHYSLAPKNLINIIFPDFYGNIRNGSYIYPDNPSYFFELHCLYCGIISALLAATGLFYCWRSKRWFSPTLVVSAVFLALGFYNPAYRWLYENMPGLDFLRVPARFWVVALLGIAMLAASGWDHAFNKTPRIAKTLILLLLSAELIWWGNRFIFTEHADLYRKPSALAIDTNPLYRIFTGKGIPADRSMLYHHFNLNGYEAIFLQRFTSYLGLRQKHVLNATGVEKPNFDDPILRALSVKYDVEPSSNCAIAFSELSSPRPRIFVPLTIKNFDRSEQIDMTNYMRSTKTGPDEEIILSNLPAGFPIASGAWQINSFTAGSIKLSAELTLKKSSAVVISDIAYTGWRAWAAGIEYPVLPANRALLCVLLPGGSYINSNKLVLYFLPPSHQLGALLTVISLLTAIAVVFILLKRKPNIVL